MCVLLGLGFTPGNVRMGAYTVAVQPSNITVDGVQVDALRNAVGNDIYNADWSKCLQQVRPLQAIRVISALSLLRQRVL